MRLFRLGVVQFRSSLVLEAPHALLSPRNWWNDLRSVSLQGVFHKTIPEAFTLGINGYVIGKIQDILTFSLSNQNIQDVISQVVLVWRESSVNEFAFVARMADA